MGNKRLISIICLMAFAMVFAHSVIPHCHSHEHHELHHNHEGHVPGPGNCELIDTYLISDSDDIPQLSFSSIELIPAEAIVTGLPQENVRIIFDHRDKFPDKSLPGQTCLGLRAPPAV